MAAINETPNSKTSKTGNEDSVPLSPGQEYAKLLKFNPDDPSHEVRDDLHVDNPSLMNSEGEHATHVDFVGEARDLLPSFHEFRTHNGFSPPAKPCVFREIANAAEYGFKRPNPDLDAFGNRIAVGSEFQYAIATKQRIDLSDTSVITAFDEIWLVYNPQDKAASAALKLRTWKLHAEKDVPSWIKNVHATASNRIFYDFKDDCNISHKSYPVTYKHPFVGELDRSKQVAHAETLQSAGQLYNPNSISELTMLNAARIAESAFGLSSSTNAATASHSGVFGMQSGNFGTPDSGSFHTPDSGISRTSLFEHAAQKANLDQLHRHDPIGSMRGNASFESRSSSSETNPAAGLFGSRSANPAHAHMFQQPSGPRPSSSINNAGNSGQLPFDPAYAFQGCSSADDCRKKLEELRPSGASVPSYGACNNRDFKDTPKTVWQEEDGSWWAYIADSNKSGQRIDIIPALSYSDETTFNTILVPETDQCFFSQPTKLRSVYIDHLYQPIGTVYSHLSRSDLIRIFHSADDATRWSRLFYFLEQIIPRPARSSTELLECKFEGKINEPWLALVMISNSLPVEFFNKLRALLSHFNDRAKLVEVSTSMDDDRFLDYTLRRADKARKLMGALNDRWLCRKSWKKFANTIQSNYEAVTSDLLKACYPLVAKDVQVADVMKTSAYLLGFCSWDRLEMIAMDIRRAAVTPFSPSNVIDSFVDCLRMFAAQNPHLDQSLVPCNSRGAPLAHAVQMIRPDEPTRALFEFSVFLATQLRTSSGVMQYEFNTAHTPGPGKKKKKNNKNGGQKNSPSDGAIVPDVDSEPSSPSAIKDKDQVPVILKPAKRVKGKGKGKGKGKRAKQVAKSK